MSMQLHSKLQLFSGVVACYDASVFGEARTGFGGQRLYRPHIIENRVSDAHVAGNAVFVLLSVQISDFQCYSVGVLKVSV